MAIPGQGGETRGGPSSFWVRSNALGRALTGQPLGKMVDSRAKSGKAKDELEPSWKPESNEMTKEHWEHVEKTQ